MTKDNEQVIDEGVIKFQLHWDETPLVDSPELTELIKYRHILRENNCIGAYAQDIGFGNVSIRLGKSEKFYISGSQTGHIQNANKSHFSLVSQCSVEKNELFCSGTVKASSESLTHSMFYQLSNQIKAVVHIHHNELWQKYKFKLPTSSENVSYGTTEMAEEIKRLYLSDRLREEKILVMAGHDEGLISFGENLTQATRLFLNLLTK